MLLTAICYMCSGVRGKTNCSERDREKKKERVREREKEKKRVREREKEKKRRIENRVIVYKVSKKLKTE